MRQSFFAHARPIPDPGIPLLRKTPRPATNTAMKRALFFTLCFCLLITAPLRAKEIPPLPVEQHASWQAIGRVNVAGFKSRGMCSGTLITPTTVLTAAHCLRKPDLTPYQLSDISFVAGWFRGDYATHAKPISITLHPKAIANGRINPGHDLALMHFDAPVPIPPIPAAHPRDLPLVGATDLAIIGYFDRRPHMLSANFDCTGQRTRDVIWINCPTRPGNSGGPILIETASGWRVISVVSAGDGKSTLAPLPDKFILP